MGGIVGERLGHADVVFTLRISLYDSQGEWAAPNLAKLIADEKARQDGEGAI